MTDDTLNAALQHAVGHWPDSTFLKIEGRDVSFAEFDQQVGRLAFGLRAAGLGPGDRLGVVMRNSLACVHTWFAANRLGAIWAPINTEFRGRSLEHAVNLLDAELFVADADLVDVLRPALDKRNGPARVLVHATSAGESHGYEQLAEFYAERSAKPVDASSADTAAMLFTSGTTGRSKACVLSHQYFLTQAGILAREFRFTQRDVLYCPFPLYHADATALTVVPALLLGATAALSRRFSASRFWDEIREVGATVFDFMGATLSILWKAPPTPDDADNPVRLAWGVPVPGDWAEDFEKRFGLKLVELYGSVEASIPVTQPYDQSRVPGSCGRVTEEFDVQVHTDDGHQTPPNTIGEIVVRPHRPGIMFDGYFAMPEATVAVSRNLWFHSGDLGRMDDDGNLYFVGRKKEAIRRRGENISAFEVEEGVLLHPDVMECAAIGVPSELTEEEVKVCVVARPDSDVTAQDIVDHCEETLAKFQVPRYIEFVEEIPKTPTGKMAKYQLRTSTDETWDRERSTVD